MMINLCVIFDDCESLCGWIEHCRLLWCQLSSYGNDQWNNQGWSNDIVDDYNEFWEVCDFIDDIAGCKMWTWFLELYDLDNVNLGVLVTFKATV